MTTPTTTPFWFKQRQCRAEPAGEQTIKVAGPNLAEAYLQVRQEAGQWKAVLRSKPDGPEVATADAEQHSERSAWDAAFELYRGHLIV
jgi:hypothetical protein